MALEQQMAPPQEQAQQQQQQSAMEQMTAEEEQDLEIAVLLTERMLEEDGYKIIEEAIKTSSDPSQVIGQFFLQLIKKLDESMPTQSKLSRRIWLAKGGWLEQVMDMVIDEFQLDPAIADKAEIYVATTAEQMGRAGLERGEQAPAGQVMPQPAPQGAPV